VGLDIEVPLRISSGNTQKHPIKAPSKNPAPMLQATS
jgi:hypothetical protein